MVKDQICYRDALATDLKTCIEIRGKTRDNPITAEQLISIGVTEEAWAKHMQTDKIIGRVSEVNEQIVGYCFADTETGEVLVLALLASFDNKGIGKRLLFNIMDKMYNLGHHRVWLAASADPGIKAHGFYRHLGWQPTGNKDTNGDEILEYHFL